MSTSLKRLVSWVALICIFVSIYQVLRTDPEVTPHTAAEPTSGSWWLTLAGIAVIGMLIVALRRYTTAAQALERALGASLAHLEAGRFEEAAEALSPALATRLPHFRRAAQAQRAEIALRRGDGEAALARAEEATTAPVGRLFVESQRQSVLRARAIAAFVRASTGDEARARADIEAVRAAPDAEATTLARAALAEAVILDRRGDRAALKAHCDRSRALWTQSSVRLDGALARAYDAMLDAGPAAVYRQPADRADSTPAPAAAWVARFAPAAAPFVRSTHHRDGGEALSLAPPTEAARRAIEAARPPHKPQKSHGVILWVLLIFAFLALWKAGVPWLAPGLGVAILGGFAGWVIWGRRRGRADVRRMREAVRVHGLGDVDAATAAFAFEPRTAWMRVQASHFRVELAFMKGRMAEALAEVDSAFARLTEAQGAQVTAPVPAADGAPAWDFPRVLAAQRAQALAALGRFDEARAELSWANGLPTALPALRVALMERLAARDIEGAARLVDGQGDDLWPAARDEVLFDLIRFVARPEARRDGEAERIRRAIMRQPYLHAWLDAVTPGLVAAFDAAAR